MLYISEWIPNDITVPKIWRIDPDINSLAQDCSNSNASAMEYLVTLTKPLIYFVQE